ncbi:hypothetical protein CDAR_29781 [Caerostris darwini]|uniref:Uncharacterized protein n=1 Tax=Caerostris darwini TaxID=1538125 RepID=A0AAV4QU73_9ARAC|nr:hypothetical protein CDAR_29781 [Caerostris darwini]
MAERSEKKNYHPYCPESFLSALLMSGCQDGLHHVHTPLPPPPFEDSRVVLFRGVVLVLKQAVAGIQRERDHLFLSKNWDRAWEKEGPATYSADLKHTHLVGQGRSDQKGRKVFFPGGCFLWLLFCCRRGFVPEGWCLVTPFGSE